MKGKLSVVMIAVMLGMVTATYANGYKILCVKGTKATAMGEAFTARADDPSAVTFNPAGLAQLRGNQVEGDLTVVNAYADYESPSGVTAHNEDRWQVVPSLFMSSDLGRNDMALGFGLSFPNGLSSEWSEDGFARYVATYSDLVVADISPAAGFRVGERLMIGAGLDVYYSKARLEKMVDMGLMAGAPGSADVRSTLTGSGTGLGGKVGLLYMIGSSHRVGLAYQHPYSIDYDGDLDFAGARSDLEATIDFPAVVVLGYAWQPAERWTVEADLDWTQWSEVDDLKVHFTTPGMPDIVQAQGLNNTVAYKLGAEYAWSEQLSLRCGYIYNQNATDEETWRPSLIDTDVHFLTGGFGYEAGNVTYNAALQLVFYERRTIDNNVDANETTSSSTIDGTYQVFAPCLSAGATYRF